MDGVGSELASLSLRPMRYERRSQFCEVCRTLLVHRESLAITAVQPRAGPYRKAGLKDDGSFSTLRSSSPMSMCSSLWCNHRNWHSSIIKLGQRKTVHLWA